MSAYSGNAGRDVREYLHRRQLTRRTITWSVVPLIVFVVAYLGWVALGAVTTLFGLSLAERAGLSALAGLGAGLVLASAAYGTRASAAWRARAAAGIGAATDAGAPTGSGLPAPAPAAAGANAGAAAGTGTGIGAGLGAGPDANAGAGGSALAALLRPLERDGWVVLSGSAVPGLVTGRGAGRQGAFEHLVIGRAGVFHLTVPAPSGRPDGPGAAGAGTGKGELAAAAARLTRILASPVPVQPLIVAPGAGVPAAPVGAGAAALVSPDQLRRWLLRRPAVLDRDQVGQLAARARAALPALLPHR